MLSNVHISVISCIIYAIYFNILYISGKYRTIKDVTETNCCSRL